MKMTQELNEALNAQASHEYRNMLAYKKIESFFESLQLVNLAEYFRKQSSHEKDHGDMIIAHLNSRTGGFVMVEEIEEPHFELIDPMQVGEVYVLLEEKTTASLEAIYDLVLKEKSFIDIGFIQGMLIEQVEEEDQAMQLSTRIKSTKDITLFDAVFDG